jgi:hypothetical protein
MSRCLCEEKAQVVNLGHLLFFDQNKVLCLCRYVLMKLKVLLKLMHLLKCCSLLAAQVTKSSFGLKKFVCSTLCCEMRSESNRNSSFCIVVMQGTTSEERMLILLGKILF